MNKNMEVRMSHVSTKASEHFRSSGFDLVEASSAFLPSFLAQNSGNSPTPQRVHAAGRSTVPQTQIYGDCKTLQVRRVRHSRGDGVMYHGFRVGL